MFRRVLALAALAAVQGQDEHHEVPVNGTADKSVFRPGQPGTPFAPAPGTRPTTFCRRWVDCVDGNWNQQRCTGGRYCRGGWESGPSDKAAQPEESSEKSAFRPGQPGTPFAPAPGTRPTTFCRRWVDCVDGNWNQQRCTGGRYCRGGWESGPSDKSAEPEESSENKAVFLP